jgi:hypothetical protein
MYSPDLIQRIFYQKEKGNTAPYEKVYNDLLAQHFEHSSSFELSGRVVYWGLFSDGKYKDIISQYEETFYFYLWNDARDFEVIMPARVYTDSGVYTNARDLPLSERKVMFYPEMWVIGPYFPGLEGITRRPLKLFRTIGRPNKEDRMSRLNQWFTTLFRHYFEEKPPLYEKEDFPQRNKRLLNGQ